MLDTPAHEGVRALIRDLNSVYRSRPALHARDCEADGFEWSVVDDSINSVFAWIRRAGEAPPIAVVANLTPVAREGYRIALPHDGVWTEILNTDAHCYGGGGKGNLGQINARDGWGVLILPPLSTIMLECAA